MTMETYVFTGDLVVDQMRKDRPDGLGPNREGARGRYVYCRPTDQHMNFNPTTNPGGCSAIYYSLCFQLPKWDYQTAKVDEFMDVSPVHADSYNLLVAQRQKLEQGIKQGLQSAAQAVADYELLAHDLRKYTEIIDYFKMGRKDEHVLRSLFVDRVDAHTGEGYSLITMARRWPTIITDFIRMKGEWIDAKKIPEPKEQLKKIMEELKVSQAEATVLKTKSELFEEWKKLFFPAIQERYARTKTLVESRKNSVDEYREWLKPYIARHKMMAEATQKKASKYTSNIYMTPGFGQASAESVVRLWAWQEFRPQEMHKPERVHEEIDPYDDIAIEWQRKIEEKYGVKFLKKDIDGLKKKMNKSALYYHVFDILCERSIIRLPQLGENEDMNFKVEHFLVSQNVMLIHLMEVEARERQFEKYVSQIIGTKEAEEDYLIELQKEFEEPKEDGKEGGGMKGGILKLLGVKKKEKKKEEKSARAKQNDEKKKEREKIEKKWADMERRRKTPGYKIKNFFESRYFIKPGPYEWQMKPRVTKIYLIPIASYYINLIEYLKFKAGVPGARKTW